MCWVPVRCAASTSAVSGRYRLAWRPCAIPCDRGNPARLPGPDVLPADGVHIRPSAEQCSIERDLRCRRRTRAHRAWVAIEPPSLRALRRRSLLVTQVEQALEPGVLPAQFLDLPLELAQVACLRRARAPQVSGHDDILSHMTGCFGDAFAVGHGSPFNSLKIWRPTPATGGRNDSGSSNERSLASLFCSPPPTSVGACHAASPSPKSARCPLVRTARAAQGELTPGTASFTPPRVRQPTVRMSRPRPREPPAQRKPADLRRSVVGGHAIPEAR